MTVSVINKTYPIVLGWAWWGSPYIESYTESHVIYERCSKKERRSRVEYNSLVVSYLICWLSKEWGEAPERVPRNIGVPQIILRRSIGVSVFFQQSSGESRGCRPSSLTCTSADASFIKVSAQVFLCSLLVYLSQIYSHRCGFVD